MKQAGFQGVFCNIRDFPAEDWNLIRTRALQQGMFCGPWARTGQGPGTFDPHWVDFLVQVADAWQSPLIVNSEKELEGTGSSITSLIASKCGARDWAVSMEPWLYPNVDWGPVSKHSMLLQINPAENEVSKHPADCKWHAHQLGCECVYFTFGTAPPQAPSWYVLQSPYSLYTGDNASPFSAWSPTSTGFDACQDPTPPPPPPMLTVKQFPYTGPYYGPSYPKGPNKGPTAKALKRMMIRLGILTGEMSKLDEHYNARLENAVRIWQRQLTDVAPTGQFGRGSWEQARAARVPVGLPHAGEYAMDDVGLRMIQKEATPPPPPSDPLVAVRAAMVDFMVRAEAHEAIWHYNDRRPYTGLDDPPEERHVNDCSSYAILVYRWARQKTGRPIKDPSGYSYSGSGNTWDNLDGHPKVNGQYLVGDLAHYDGHVTICKKPGDHLTSRWSSFGQESGPQELRLYYRDDLRFVCRPPL